MAPADRADPVGRVAPAWRPGRLVVASGNAHKVAELQRMLRAAVPALEVRGLHDLRAAYGPAPVIDETADDFAGNARLKAEGIAAWLRERGEPGDTVVLADDSGVCVDALQGRPGVYSARFAGPGASDEDNNERLVGELRARGLQASAGHYRCVLALARVDARAWGEARSEVGSEAGSEVGSEARSEAGSEARSEARSEASRAGLDSGPASGPAVEGSSRLFEGRWDVELRLERRGTGGFGYDPHAWLTEVPAGGRTVAELSADDKAALSHRGQAMRALLAWLTGP